MKLVKKKYSPPALPCSARMLCEGDRGGIRQRLLMIFLVPCLFFSLQGQGNPFSEPGSALLDSANFAYANGNFEKASGLYQDILKMGYEAPEVYFNLGNTYFKLDEVGLSVLYYERAKKLSPYDEDLNFNLKLVNQRTLDKVEPLPRLFLEEWWESLMNMHSEKTWSIRSIISFLIFLFFLGVLITSNKVATKQMGFWLGILFFAFSVFSFFIAKSSYGNIISRNTAIILSSSVEVKNSPSETGKKLFILHEGTKVSTPDTSGEWAKIELSSEKVGWVKRSALEFI
ncbi:MAG: hypothetical protein EPN85_08355 [Bacteroidetes bacterium]|nr:MAG: hypothetical protein EPN85_08355 [Bacteroidota bacterium]